MSIEPLNSDRQIIIYIDFKSPYAYLAIEPTRALEKELGISFDWRPFVLDIPSYLGSASLDKAGKVARENRSAEQWSGVKYAYYDCRRYASLSAMTIRGTTKIWDTNLVATAMLWVREYHEQALPDFIDAIYVPFWKRDFDAENPKLIDSILDSLGADSQAFQSWYLSEGRELNNRLQADTFAAGIYGVPTYVVENELFFGREHLPRVRWLLTGSTGPAPDIANPLPDNLAQQPAPASRVVVGIDESLDSLLALPRLKALLDQYTIATDWVRIAPRKATRPAPADDLSRSATHKRLRVQNRQRDARRYAPPNLPESNYQAAIARELERLDISLKPEVPEQFVRPAMPGVAILMDDELFLGRQHLPLIQLRLGPPTLQR